MSYRLKTGEDTPFELDHGAITLKGWIRGQRRGSARSPNYGEILRIILTSLRSAGISISNTYVVRGSERRIIDARISAADSDQLASEMSQRVARTVQSGIRIELGDDISRGRLVALLDAEPIGNEPRGAARLFASELRVVSAVDVWSAREELLRSRDYAPFDDSDEYDVLLEDGQRLPPKALVGRALSRAIGFRIEPKHFTGGASSTCFSILSEFGYQIVPKGATVVAAPTPPDDGEWAEGDKKNRWHLTAERKAGLAAAKRGRFRIEHGELFCEHCRMDPIEIYGAKFGESCIEVHHARVTVADMRAGHRTRLEDLQCLCANCHRIEHQRMRTASRHTRRGRLG